MTESNDIKWTRQQSYYYAVGYHDGRRYGNYDDRIDIPEEFNLHYYEGYWAGVSDYSSFDSENV